MPSSSPKIQTHHAFLGGTPQARTQHVLERLTAWQREQGVLSESCYLVVQHRQQVQAWQAFCEQTFPQAVRFQGIKVMSWFQWSLNWLNQSIGLVPQVVAHFRHGLGLEAACSPPVFQQDTWQLLSSTDLLLVLEAYWVNQPSELSPPPAQAVEGFDKARLLSDLLATKHLSDWHTLCESHFSELKDAYGLSELYAWFVQHTVAQGMLPYAWVEPLAWATVDFLQRHEAEALHHFCQGIRLLMVDYTHALPETSRAWMRLLEEEGTTIWSLGDDFSFHKRIAENAFVEEGEPASWRALSRPPFWDAVKDTLTLPVGLTFLPDEQPERSEPPETCGFKEHIQTRWQASAPLANSKAPHIHAHWVQSLDSLDEAHRVAVAERVLACLENALACQQPTPLAIVVPTRKEKEQWKTFLSQCLGAREATEEALLWAWLEIGQTFLSVCADFPQRAIEADTCLFNPRHEPMWQVHPRLWVNAPDWADALQGLVNQAWTLIHPNRHFTAEAFQSFLATLSQRLSLQAGEASVSFSAWLWAWLAPFSAVLTPSVEGVYKRAEALESRLQSAQGLGSLPLKAWGGWLHSTLEAQRSLSAPDALSALVAVYTLEEAPAYALHTVIIPQLFQASREERGLKNLLQNHQSESLEAVLTPLTQTFNALNEVETWVHQLAGVKALYFILQPEHLHGYNDAQRQVFQHFFADFFNQGQTPFTAQNKDALEGDTPLLTPQTLNALSELRDAVGQDALAYPSYGQGGQTPLSPSDLDTYVKCPRQLYYKRFKFSTPFNAKASRGTLVHKMFELFHHACNAKSLSFDSERLTHFVRQCLDVDDPAMWQPPQALLEEPAFNVYVQQPIVVRQSWLRRFLEAVESLQETGYFEKTPVRVDTEFRIKAKLAELAGFDWKMFIDAIFHYEDGSIRLVDYKTAKGTFEQRKAEGREAKVNRILEGLPQISAGQIAYDASVSDDLYWQLPIYLLAYEALSSQQVSEAGLQLFRSIQENQTGSVYVPFDVSRFHAEKARWLENVQEEVLTPLWQERQFRANPQTSYCQWCDYTSICDSSTLQENEL
jgi:hypothetical protein